MSNFELYYKLFFSLEVEPAWKRKLPASDIA